MATISDIIERLRPSSKEIHIIIVTSIISLVARWTAFFPLAYAIDDYRASLSLSCGDLGPVLVSQGRWGAYCLNRALEFIGFYVYYYSTFGFALSSILLILSGVLICRIWHIKDRAPMFLVVAFMVMHPYQVELFTFKIASLFGAPIFISILGLYLCSINRAMYAASVLMVAVSLSVNQLVLNYLTMILLFAVLSELIMQCKRDAIINWNIFDKSNHLTTRFSIIIIGVILYVLMSGIIIMVNNSPLAGRTTLLHFDSLAMRLSQLALLGKTVFFKQEPLLPLYYKYLFNLIFATFFFLSARNAFLLKDNKRFLSFCVVLLLTAISLLNIVGLNLALQEWWPVPRVLSVISVFWGGIIAFTYMQARNSAQRVLVLTPSIILLVGAIAINNTVLAEQLKINMRDMHRANRIIARMETHPEFSRVKKIAIIGSMWGYPSSIRTAAGDMNISAFGASWSKVPLLNEVSGYRFLQPDGEEYKYAEEYCSDSPKWPNEDSLTIHDDLAVLCF